MAKTYHSSNRWALTGLFKRINLGDDPKTLRREASHLVEKVDSDDIQAAQQAMVEEGYSAELVQKISAVFILMGLRKKHTADKKNTLPDNHLLQKMAVEHSMTRCYLEDLMQITDEIDQLDTVTSVCSEFRRLTHIIDYFQQFKRHIEREEDIIFPYLKKFGWEGLCKTDTDEHKHMIKDIDNLVALITSLDMIKSDRFKDYLRKIADHFVSTTTEHLAYEEDLLWPIALIVVDNPDVWQVIKALCDEFEY